LDLEAIPLSTPNLLNVSKCGTVHHHLRNGMMVIMGQVCVLKSQIGTEQHRELTAIIQQIVRMENAMAGCFDVTSDVPLPNSPLPLGEGGRRPGEGDLGKQDFG